MKKLIHVGAHGRNIVYVTKFLKKSIINQSAKNLETLLQLIKQYTNPFALELSEDHLYNISKGQSVNDKIYKLSASLEIEGEKQHINFITETRAMPGRFDKAINKNKIDNFDYKNVQKLKINGKIKEVKIQRDVFGRLLYASLTNKIDRKIFDLSSGFHSVFTLSYQWNNLQNSKICNYY